MLLDDARLRRPAREAACRSALVAARAASCHRSGIRSAEKPAAGASSGRVSGDVRLRHDERDAVGRDCLGCLRRARRCMAVSVSSTAAAAVCGQASVKACRAAALRRLLGLRSFGCRAADGTPRCYAAAVCGGAFVSDVLRSCLGFGLGRLRASDDLRDDDGGWASCDNGCSGNSFVFGWVGCALDNCSGLGRWLG